MYGALAGKAVVDGFHGPFLEFLVPEARLPKGYVPVGIRCTLFQDLGSAASHTAVQGRESFFCSIIAVKSGTQDCRAIRANVTTPGHLDDEIFKVEGLAANEVLQYIKRAYINVLLDPLDDLILNDVDEGGSS